MRPEMRMRPALADDCGVSVTRSTRTCRRGSTGSVMLQLGRAGLGGAVFAWLAQLGLQVAAGQAVCAVHLEDVVAINQSIKFWNDRSKPKGKNNAMPIGSSQQAVLNTDETVALNVSSGRCGLDLHAAALYKKLRLAPCAVA